MKLVVLWLAAAVVTAAAIGSCSVNHRSNDFSCERTSDCASGRVCSDGVCVSNQPVDAGARDAASVCPAGCTSCNVGTRSCRIDCSANGSCTQGITCPAGWSCDIDCSGDGSCRDNLDCNAATACKVTCSGAGSCRAIACGPGKCDVACTGSGACRTIDCLDACACDVTCNDAAACTDLTCKDLRCFPDTLDNGCSSQPRLCDTCD